MFVSSGTYLQEPIADLTFIELLRRGYQHSMYLGSPCGNRRGDSWGADSPYKAAKEKVLVRYDKRIDNYIKSLRKIEVSSSLNEVPVLNQALIDSAGSVG